jgi:hypothetical protein
MRYGIISLAAAAMGKNILFWTSIDSDQSKNKLGSNYPIILNAICGVISLFAGLYLLLN